MASLLGSCSTVVRASFTEVNRRVRGAWNALRRSLGERGASQRIVILLASFLVCAYAAGVLSYVMLTPDIGVRCAFTPVVNHFYTDFLSPVTQDPLRDGDRIIKVGDHPVETWPQLLRTLIELQNELAVRPDGETVAEGVVPTSRVTEGQPVVRVEYTREGEADPREVWLRVGPPPLETLLPSVLWFFLKMVLFVVGAIVFWQRPQDRSVAQFFLLCTLSFGAFMGGYHWWRIVTQPVLIVVFMVCAFLLPAVTLHFYLLFPRPKQLLEAHPRTTLLTIYGPAVLFFVLVLAGYLRVRLLYHHGQPGGVSPEALALLLQEILSTIYVYFVVASLMYLASVVSLMHSYRTPHDATERNQVKVILLGAAAALVPLGYSLYLALAEQTRFGGGAATWPMFAASACFVVAYTVSITRYRLMELDQLISSGAIYFLVSFLAAAVYYGLVFAGTLLIGSRIIDAPSFGQALWVSGTALVLMFVLDRFRWRLKGVLDRLYRREKHQLDRTLKRMSEAIEQLVDPMALARRLLRTSADLLGVERGAVYLRQGNPAVHVLADSLGPPPLAELAPGGPLLDAVLSRGSLDWRPRALPHDPAERQLHHLGGEVAHALIHEGHLLGLLVLGPRAGGPYTAEDSHLLAAFAQIAALALVSAEGHRTIESLNQELKAKVEKIAEQQRRILSLQSQLTKRTARSPEQETTTALKGSEVPPVAAVADGVVGSSPVVRQVLHLVRKVAGSPTAVLLRGESGTGKELLARAIHDNSPRAAKAFVTVHSAALAPGLLESELFGHVKGAFTNAVRDKVGRFEAADGGTLFLDEIGDVSLEVQTKLLRVLQEMTFERVGSSESIRVDVRVIAATHQDLESLIRQGRFREDLFYRLNVFPIRVPPLRERAEDVPELVQHFLQVFAKRAGKDVSGVDDDALAALKAYPWPGNVRQLENVIERAVVMAEDSVVTSDLLPPELVDTALEVESSPTLALWPLKETEGGLATAVVAEARAERERRERDHLVRALAASAGNKAEAARALGIARSTFISKLKRHGLSG